VQVVSSDPGLITKESGHYIYLQEAYDQGLMEASASMQPETPIEPELRPELVRDQCIDNRSPLRRRFRKAQVIHDKFHLLPRRRSRSRARRALEIWPRAVLTPRVNLVGRN
jgi:hypothetical protein